MPAPTIPLNFRPREPGQILERARSLHGEMWTRRSVRQFSDRPVPRDIIEQLIHTATSMPSGANLQPYHFVAVGNAEMKRQIREAAEHEERINYVERRLGDPWLEDLEHLGTNEHKPFLELAPWLVVLFRRDLRKLEEETRKNYYVKESTGLAAGMFVAAVHYAGLATLTYTPSPMMFLQKLLQRPPEEKPWLVMPVGYPADDCEVPDIHRKPLNDMLTVVD